MNAFAEFVKGNFAKVKRENPEKKHREIMGILVRKYREEKKGEEGGSRRELIVVEESEDEIGEIATVFDDLELQ